MGYAQLVTEHVHVCNAVMLFASLERDESMAQRILLYPQVWDRPPKDGAKRDAQRDTSMRLLRKAAKDFKVMLQAVEPMKGANKGEGITETMAINTSRLTNIQPAHSTHWQACTRSAHSTD